MLNHLQQKELITAKTNQVNAETSCLANVVVWKIHPDNYFKEFFESFDRGTKLFRGRFGAICLLNKSKSH